MASAATRRRATPCRRPRRARQTGLGRFVARKELRRSRAEGRCGILPPHESHSLRNGPGGFRNRLCGGRRPSRPRHRRARARRCGLHRAAAAPDGLGGHRVGDGRRRDEHGLAPPPPVWRREGAALLLRRRGAHPLGCELSRRHPRRQMERRHRLLPRRERQDEGGGSRPRRPDRSGQPTPSARTDPLTHEVSDGARPRSPSRRCRGWRLQRGNPCGDGRVGARRGVASGRPRGESRKGVPDLRPRRLRGHLFRRTVPRRERRSVPPVAPGRVLAAAVRPKRLDLLGTGAKRDVGPLLARNRARRARRRRRQRLVTPAKAAGPTRLVPWRRQGMSMAAWGRGVSSATHIPLRHASPAPVLFRLVAIRGGCASRASCGRSGA